MQSDSESNIPVPDRGYTARNTKSQRQSKKRPRSSSKDGADWMQDENSNHVTERSNSVGTVDNQTHLIGIDMRDSQKLREYLYGLFAAFDQANCRTLCKSWIKVIEPKKQANYPYTGVIKGKGGRKLLSSQSSASKDGDPEGTKPKWWPPKEECPHKEPDHIKKER